MPTDVVIPASIPPALSRVRLQWSDPALTVPKDQGETRRLPRFPGVPQQAFVQWYLNQDQFDDFWDWFEDTLVAGSRRFDFQLERQGGPGAGSNARLSWHTAQFVEQPYTAAASSTGDFYTVSATLLLIGAPFDTRTAPGLLASGVNARSGGARFIVASIVASGTNSRDGGAVSRDTTVRASGTNGRDGGWNTGVAPLGADEALAALWFGIDLDDTASDAQDAQAAAFADFGP